jgi:GT2 family glycosyltransferase
LKSIESYAPAENRVCIVDNDSCDATVEMVRTEFPKMGAIEDGTNLGFARATRQAVSAGSARR